MYHNSFSLRVVGGDEQSGGYVNMAHGQKYSLQMRSDREERCDAHVEIDGQHVGTWRIERRSTINISHKNNVVGQFTFYRLGSEEAQHTALNGASPDLGLVKVTFTPEVQAKPVLHDSYSLHFNNVSFGPKGSLGAGTMRSAGGTGLSGQSSQHFTNAGKIEYDRSQETVIQLRLVWSDIETPRPLTAYSTPYPPRIS